MRLTDILNNTILIKEHKENCFKLIDFALLHKNLDILIKFSDENFYLIKNEDEKLYLKILNELFNCF